MTPEVVRATTDRVPALAAILGRAFADDPMMVFCFGADAGETVTRRMFEIVDAAFAGEGWLWEVGPGAGVAMWVPPDGMARYHEIEDATDAATSALTPDGGENERALWDWIAAHLPDEPQWYLDHLAVDAEHRGRGLGTALVRWGLERSADAGVPATLETARPRNVELYEHLGFRTVGEGDVPGGGPHLWVMRADPRNRFTSGRSGSLRGVAEVVVFHHALGLTSGVRSFADELRAAGHTVHTPDLFEGRTFASLDEGVEHGKDVGWSTIAERGRAALDGLPAALVYAGMSMGVMCAQEAAQTRPGARGALFLYGCFPPSEFGTAWPADVPVQIHLMDRDPWSLEDIDAARALAADVEGAQLFLYDGDRHVFVDPSASDYDEAAATLATERALAFLAALD